MKGDIIFRCKPKLGLVTLGFSGPAFLDYTCDRGVFELNGSLVFFGSARLGLGVNLCVNGELQIGDNLQINGRSTIICYDLVNIGCNVLISWDVTILDTDFHPIYFINGPRINPDRAVSIGNNVWLGFGVKILKGAGIPSGCVISASAVVTNKLDEESCIYAGNKQKLAIGVEWKR
jgi:acetyltransferase-like isoleucine patch superfamily enzyme